MPANTNSIVVLISDVSLQISDIRKAYSPQSFQNKVNFNVEVIGIGNYFSLILKMFKSIFTAKFVILLVF